MRRHHSGAKFARSRVPCVGRKTHRASGARACDFRAVAMAKRRVDRAIAQRFAICCAGRKSHVRAFHAWAET
eukprot:5939380-Lingulodinium_polyedra.AAC.1